MSSRNQSVTGQNLPIIIFSTSMDMDVIDTIYNNGAHYYLRKPGELSKLKVINDVILLLRVSCNQAKINLYFNQSEIIYWELLPKGNSHYFLQKMVAKWKTFERRLE
jgi:response regulator of citrate/malate metabolism